MPNLAHLSIFAEIYKFLGGLYFLPSRGVVTPRSLQMGGYPAFLWIWDLWNTHIMPIVKRIIPLHISLQQALLSATIYILTPTIIFLCISFCAPSKITLSQVWKGGWLTAWQINFIYRATRIFIKFYSGTFWRVTAAQWKWVKICRFALSVPPVCTEILSYLLLLNFSPSRSYFLKKKIALRAHGDRENF